jgi:ribonuclease Z
LQKMPKDALSLAEAVRSHLCSKDIEIANSLQDLPSPDSEIIFLGTGSSLPSRYRNVSATLLRVPGIGSYLFDCGESTLGQLSRMYDSEELAEVLQDLKMIWISHLHADHHLGTTSVIKAWYKAVYGDQHRDISFITPSVAEQLEDPDRYFIGQKRLFITSDKAMNDWLAEYASVEDFGYDKLVPLNVWAARNGEPESTSYRWDKTPVVFNEAIRKATGLTRLAAANVKHCHGSKGVSVTFSTGFKFTYSGDCRPSYGLMEIGKGSTVLLHEATFDDELRGDAKAKLHSTISEAIGVGVAMGAQRVLLTHFSQRYQKLPIMDTLDDSPLELEDDEGDLIDPMAGMDTQELPSISLGEAVESDMATDDLLQGKRLQVFKDGPKIRKVHRPLAKRQGQDMKVGVGFDFMRVKVKDIAILEKFTPALLKLYEEAPVTSSDGENDEKKLERLKEQKQKLQEKRIGGGRMGRVKKTEKEKESMRNGIGLFDDNRGLEKISAASQRADL